MAADTSAKRSQIDRFTMRTTTAATTMTTMMIKINDDDDDDDYKSVL